MIKLRLISIETDKFMGGLFKTVSVCVLVVVLVMLSSCVSAGSDDLSNGFLNPPSQARPHTYWFWMNGNITREGITADLEAMSRVGIGGVLIMNVAGPIHRTDIPAGPVDYLGHDWLKMVK